MQMLTKIWRKSESSLSFSYENSVTEGTNLRPIKAMRRSERFLSLAVKRILLEKHAHRAYNWPEYACINLSDVLLISWCMAHV